LGGGYTSPYTYTNLGQIWQGPVNGKGSAEQYLYCNSAPHQLTGIYPTGTTCANKGSATAVYSASYDAWGNETSRTYNSVTATLSYDTLNRMTEYSAGANSQEFYLYDGAGNRVLKRTISGGTTTLTAYAFGLQELSYTGSGAFSSQIDYYAIAGHLIGSTNGTTTTYDLTDAEGSVLTSLSSSAILGEQIYDPYGNQRYTQGTMGTDKGYTGQFQDAATGLDYYNARYYDPVMGQFLSADVKQGNAQGMDPYAYVNGNPETATDPTGQAGVCAWCSETGIAGGSTAASGTYPTIPTCSRGFYRSGTSCLPAGGGSGGSGSSGGSSSKSSAQGGSKSNPCSEGPQSDNQCTYSNGECQGRTFNGCQAEMKAQNIAKRAADYFQGQENYWSSNAFLSQIPFWVINRVGLLSAISSVMADLAMLAGIYARGFSALANGPLNSFDCALCFQDEGMGDAASRAIAQVIKDTLILGAISGALDLVGFEAAQIGGMIAKIVGGVIAGVGTVAVADPVSAVIESTADWSFSYVYETKYDGYLQQISQVEFEGGF
jgi:RHS repeat-associated protein